MSPLLMTIYYFGNTQCPIGLIPCSLGLNRDQETESGEAQIFVSLLYYRGSNSST